MNAGSVNLAPVYQVPAILSQFEKLIAAESTRHGGISPVPFASLNLGINTADDPANIVENRRLFFNALLGDLANDKTKEYPSVGFASSHQVHGTEVLYATEAGRFDGYDALMTDKRDLLVGVTVADCVPILIYDSAVGRQAVAAIHAGWRGAVDEIVTKTLAAMQEQFGTQAEDCYAYVGTCIDETSFEVGPEVAEQFGPDLKRTDPYTQKQYVNLKAANTKQLVDFGIPPDQIGVSAFSTVLNNEDYFSFRAERGETGRMLAVIGVRF